MTMEEPFFRLKGDAVALIDWANIFSSQQKNGWQVDTAKLHAFLKGHALIKDIVFFHGEDVHPLSKAFLEEQRTIGYRVISKPVKTIPVRIDESVFRSKIGQLEKDLGLLREKNSTISSLLYSLDERLRLYMKKQQAMLTDDFYGVFDIIESIDHEIANADTALQFLWNNIRGTIVRRKCDFDVEISREILLNLDTYQSFILFSGDGDYAPIFDALRERRKQAILVFPHGCRGKEYEEVPERKRAIFLCSLELIKRFTQA
ncbi:NYN domain-containing protein [Candidatus Peregrinibacteria bacterium]|nr:NYN domain-containing protein [Candidatus Peregrinibacteria bacterium]